MFGIRKKIEEAMNKAQTDPAAAIEESRKAMNSGLTGFATNVLMGKEFANRVNSVIDRNQNILAGLQDQLKLIQTGLDGTAEVHSVQDTGNSINDNPVVVVQMTVTPASGMPYEVTHRTMVSRIVVPRVGDKVRIKYSAENPQQVTILGTLPGFGTATPA
jgi:hypothetical protein